MSVEAHYIETPVHLDESYKIVSIRDEGTQLGCIFIDTEEKTLEGMTKEEAPYTHRFEVAKFVNTLLSSLDGYTIIETEDEDENPGIDG